MSDDVQVNQNLTQAQTWLAQSQKAPRIGSIGWCFGGGMSLRTALLLPEAVDASIIYYGFVDPDSDQLPSLNVPLLGLFGAEDDGIPVATVEAFADRLEALDKDAEIIIYDDADHAFANPSGNRYNAEAAEAAWQETLSFFAAHLQENE